MAGGVSAKGGREKAQESSRKKEKEEENKKEKVLPKSNMNSNLST